MIDTTIIIPGQAAIYTSLKVASTSMQLAIRASGIKFTRVMPSEDTGDLYRWGCIRHPLDRLVSAWRFFCHQETDGLAQREDLQALGYKHHMDFESFLAVCGQEPHTWPQVLHIPDDLDCLVKFENLGEEWELLRQRIPGLGELPMTHKTDHMHWKIYYNQYNRQLTEAEYQEDLDLYETAR